MSEKVVLTAEQAEEVERLRKQKFNESFILETFFERDDRWKLCRVFTEGDVELLTKALFIGYEIEKSKFEIGEKVFSGNTLLTIYDITNDGRYELRSSSGGRIVGSAKYLRKLTPEEIYWLETLGRDKVMDFRENDIYVDGDGDLFELSQNGQRDNYTRFSSAEKWYKSGGDFKGIYPADSFKPFPKEESE